MNFKKTMVEKISAESDSYRIRSEREKCGLSIMEISASLRINEKILSAIEAASLDAVVGYTQ